LDYRKEGERKPNTKSPNLMIIDRIGLENYGAHILGMGVVHFRVVYGTCILGMVCRTGDAIGHESFGLTSICGATKNIPTRVQISIRFQFID